MIQNCVDFGHHVFAFTSDPNRVVGPKIIIFVNLNSRDIRIFFNNKQYESSYTVWIKDTLVQNVNFELRPHFQTTALILGVAGDIIYL